MRRVVCRSEELPPGGLREVDVEGRSVVVLRTRAGALCALRGVCPHQGAPLSRGTLTGTTVPSTPFQYRYGRRGEILRCPWHHYEFDVLTGRALVDPDRCRVATYRVDEAGGEVLLTEERPVGRAAPGAGTPTPGPQPRARGRDSADMGATST